jgi:hypothetical protein
LHGCIARLTGRWSTWQESAGGDAVVQVEEVEPELAQPQPAPQKSKKRRRVTDNRRNNGATRLFTSCGYFDVARSVHRSSCGRTAIVDGDVRSCGQDAIVNGAKALGVSVTKQQVHDDTLPGEGDTEVGVLVAFAHSQLGISMLDTRIPATLGSNIWQATGGPEHALLQLTEGVFFVELVASFDPHPCDRHVVVYHAAYEQLEYPDVRGAIIDNHKDTPIKLIRPSDRMLDFTSGRGVPNARKVFHSLFSLATSVRVTGVWLMVMHRM